VVELKTNFCNVCGSAVTFPAELVCPNCKSTSFERSLYRFLAESNFTYRKLKTLLIGDAVALLPLWKTMFQGAVLPFAGLSSETVAHPPASFDIIAVRVADNMPDASRPKLSDCLRILKPGGTLLYCQPYGRVPLVAAAKLDKLSDADCIASFLEAQDLRVKARIRYASAAVRYSDYVIFRSEKPL
jgi:SAM-dependent methyltransferase